MEGLVRYSFYVRLGNKTYSAEGYPEADAFRVWDQDFRELGCTSCLTPLQSLSYMLDLVEQEHTKRKEEIEFWRL